MDNSLPKNLHLFIYWGINFTEKNDDEFIASCPFCLHDDTKTGQGHFFCNSKTKAWDCKSCGKQGSWRDFLRYIHEKYLKKTTDEQLMYFVNWKKIPLIVLKKWKLAKYKKNIFFFPVYDYKNEIVDLRRYKLFKNQDKENLTAGTKAGLLGIKQLLNENRKEEPIYLCESSTDLLILDWLLRRTKQKGIVISAPGANTFKIEWADYFEDRIVNICYDNDEKGYGIIDYERNKATGSRKVAAYLNEHAKEINFLNWPDNYPDKYDIKDFINKQKNKPNNCYSSFIKLIKHHHKHDKDKPKKVLSSKGNIKLKEIIDEAKKIYEVGKVFEIGIKIALATVLSVQISGSDNIWMFLMGPPAYGKTLILSMLEKSRKCIWCSTLSSKALISGWGLGSSNNFIDPSILAKVNNKCLTLKDYTEVLGKNESEKKEITSILTGGYDGRVKRPYGTGERDYKCKFSMIAGVTYIILTPENSTSQLGDRFLKYNVFDFNTDLDKIQEKALRLQLLGQTANAKLHELSTKFLDNNYDFSGESLLSKTPRWFFDRTKPLSELITKLRTILIVFEKGSKYGHLVYKPESESPTRIFVQLNKLAQTLCLIEEKNQIDEDIYDIIKTVALDTVYGINTNIIKFIANKRDAVTIDDIKIALKQKMVAGYVNELEQLKIIEKSKDKERNKKIIPTYKLTKVISDLWNRAKL